MGFLLVGIGGALGAMARYGVARLIGPSLAFPWSTFIVNVAGGFLMGLLAGWLAARADAGAEPLRLLLGVGVLGGFTTFSAYSLDLHLLIARGDWLTAALYALGSMLLALLALMAGLWLMRTLLP
ncbi:MAG: fluoride efflux transporter CrcB [Sphingomonadaceae bacterium]